MKTISTKLDNRDFEKYLEKCNYEGQCVSESLRELIRMDIDAYEEGLELDRELEENKLQVITKPKVTLVRKGHSF